MKKLRVRTGKTTESKRKASSEENNFNIKELFVRDNRTQRKSKSVKKKYNKSICGYDNICKESRTCILGKICTVVVRNEPKLQPSFGLLDIFLELAYCVYYLST